MQKMKNGKKVLSVCLSLAMAAGMLSTSAFASWNVYGGSNNHNAVVTEAPTAPDKSGLDSYIQLHCTGSGWDGVDNVPVLQTVNGTTYAYVLYDGYGASGALVAKIRCAENGGSSIVWTTDPYGTEGTSLNAKSGFQLSTPYLDDNGTPNDASDDTLYVGTISQYDDYEGGEWLTGTGSKVMALTGLDQNKPTVTNVLTGINGQINTPITTDGTYLYFGTWPGGSNAGTYYQVKLSDYSVKTFTPDSYGFYWAGAVSDGTNVYFGSDNGLLYWRSIADFDTTGGVLDPDRCGQRRGQCALHRHDGRRRIPVLHHPGRLPVVLLLQGRADGRVAHQTGRHLHLHPHQGGRPHLRGLLLRLQCRRCPVRHGFYW